MGSETQSVDYRARQRQLADLVFADGIQAVVLNPGASLIYFTGLHFHLMERPVLIFIRRDRPPVIVLPGLEAGKLGNLPYDHQAFQYGEDPVEWPEVFFRASQAANISGGKLGIEPQNLRVLELRYLEAAAPGVQLTSAATAIAALRVRKSPAELGYMRRAAKVAEVALEKTLPRIRLDMTEKELSAELVVQLLRAGTETPLPFSPIVAFGPNTANPHAYPTNRKLASGDLVLFDWGATVEGYVSDITRMFVAGEPSPEFARIANLAAAANQAAREIAGPGVMAGEVDKAARAAIAGGGYGAYFRHRTGHGLGMEAHEDPYIREGSEEILSPGMTFTIEPGIYLDGQGGVRVEDDMVITETGAESLTTLPRELGKLAVA